MSSNYHANQFESAFKPTKLKNWEVPKYSYSERPHNIHRKPITIISDSNGHLLSNVPRSSKSPWGNYKNTWELPRRITRKQAEELCNQLVVKKAVQCTKDKKNTEIKKTVNSNSNNLNFNKLSDEKTVNENLNLTYTPGDLCKPNNYVEDRQQNQQHQYQQNQLNCNDESSNTYQLNDLYLEKHRCNKIIPAHNKSEGNYREISKNLHNNLNDTYNIDDQRQNNGEKMKLSSNNMPDKPNEIDALALTASTPAYCNFQLARKMHQENLEHQPLPDSILDQAFRKLQSQRNETPGLALDVMPQTNGVAIKTYNAGPTHCTKMKVYRPKTCGVVPKPIDDTYYRPKVTHPVKNKMGSMDLAICWDYRPQNPINEPKPPKHIDGSNGSAAPAVFTLVKTPRTPDDKPDTGRSGGVFTNTLGEPGFFDKDILLRKTNFSQRNKTTDSKLKCSCATSPINQIKDPFFRKSNSASKIEEMKRCQSSPNLSLLALSDDLCKHRKNIEIKNTHNQNRKHTCSKYGTGNKLKNDNEQQQLLIRNSTSENDLNIHPQTRKKPVCKYKLDVSKKCHLPTKSANSDSGCSTMSSTSCSTKILYIPRPRNPYSKKNYNIDTLVPPFTCIKGGAGQGGYPEHWRLMSVYQQAYKPIEQRKCSLLKTVYK